MTARLAVLASGRGSNLAAILEAGARGGLDARVVVVFADRPTATALRLAHDHHIAHECLDARHFTDRAAYDAALDARLHAFAPDFVVLAGFMRLLSPGFVAKWLGRVVNIHPSLLPAYPGLHTHRRALADGARVHGASVHFVVPELDAGPVVMQAEVPILAGDDQATLAARVLRAEHQLYPAALARIVSGQVAFRDGALYSGGRKLESPDRLRLMEVA